MVVNLDKITSCGKEHTRYACIADGRNKVYEKGLVYVFVVERPGLTGICGKENEDYHWLYICKDCYFRNGLEW